MSGKSHSHIEVDREDFLAALRDLSQMDLIPGRMSKGKRAALEALKIRLYREGRKFVVSIGAFSERMPAKGNWKRPAVLPFRTLDAMISLAASSKQDTPLILEGVASGLRIGTATLPCDFEDAPVDMSAEEDFERKLQRVIEGETVRAEVDRSRELEQEMALAQLRRHFPRCQSAPLEDKLLVTVPDFPQLLLHLRTFDLELRILARPASPPSQWLADSTLWKCVSYPALRELGVENLVPYAGRIAAAQAEGVNQDSQK